MKKKELIERLVSEIESGRIRTLGIYGHGASGKSTFAQELYQQFCLDVKENNPRVIHKLIKVNRKVILRILDIIEEEGNKDFIPCLEAYKKIETKRIGRRIIEVEKTIKDRV